MTRTLTFIILLLSLIASAEAQPHAKKFTVTFTITYDSVSLGTASILEDVIRHRNRDAKVDVTVSEMPKPTQGIWWRGVPVYTVLNIPKWHLYNDSTWLRRQK
jgi:hypothetical protein